MEDGTPRLAASPTSSPAPGTGIYRSAPTIKSFSFQGREAVRFHEDGRIEIMPCSSDGSLVTATVAAAEDRPEQDRPDQPLSHELADAAALFAVIVGCIALLAMACWSWWRGR